MLVDLVKVVKERERQTDRSSLAWHATVTMDGEVRVHKYKSRFNSICLSLSLSRSFSRVGNHCCRWFWFELLRKIAVNYVKLPHHHLLLYAIAKERERKGERGREKKSFLKWIEDSWDAMIFPYKTYDRACNRRKQ